jgi:hypothetical protein
MTSPRGGIFSPHLISGEVGEKTGRDLGFADSHTSY